MRSNLALLILFFCFSGCDEDGAEAGDSTDAQGVRDNGTDTQLVVDSGSNTQPADDGVVDRNSDVQPRPDAGDLSYSTTIFENLRLSSHAEDEHFQSATAKVDFGEGPYASVALEVELNTTCYPFSAWRENPPPEGENWPADCDAFDRNFEFTLDEPKEGSSTPPAIELLRAITPFGGPMRFEVDVTDVVNGLPGIHQLKVHITTWSDAAGQVSGSHGGWNVTARLRFTPGPAPRQVLAVIPIYNGDQGAPLLDEPSFTLRIPEGANAARLEYRITGHGGANDPSRACTGPAEEFCQREHIVELDGEEVDRFIPWRDDCGELCSDARYGSDSEGFDYCLENPCGAIRSGRASRANWCPGSLTPPRIWTEAELPSLSITGEHALSWRIQGLVEGGSWRVSMLYFAFKTTSP